MCYGRWDACSASVSPKTPMCDVLSQSCAPVRGLEHWRPRRSLRVAVRIEALSTRVRRRFRSTACRAGHSTFHYVLLEVPPKSQVESSNAVSVTTRRLQPSRLGAAHVPMRCRSFAASALLGGAPLPKHKSPDSNERRCHRHVFMRRSRNLSSRDDPVELLDTAGLGSVRTSERRGSSDFERREAESGGVFGPGEPSVGLRAHVSTASVGRLRA